MTRNERVDFAEKCGYNLMAEMKFDLFAEKFDTVTFPQLDDFFRGTPSELKKKDDEIENLKDDLRCLQDEYQELQDAMDEKTVEWCEQEFKKHNDITSSLTDEMKFDLIMKNYHKVSLEDFEHFFKSKGLEIV